MSDGARPGILFGHPTGGHASHNAGLAHFERGRLDSFCVPWMPSAATLSLLEALFPRKEYARRLGRRHFQPLTQAKKVQDRPGEFKRLLMRAMGYDGDILANDANDWLMHTMTRECRNRTVTAVHAYEDCSLSQFEEAKRLGKACLYDMPVGYYPAWESLRDSLQKKYADWLPAMAVPSHVRREQKIAEMNLADLVLAPSRFSAATIQQFHPKKIIGLAPYGVDLAKWPMPENRSENRDIRFLFAGRCSVLKGVPLLIEAWRAAGLKEANLRLVGSWQLSEQSKGELPPGCSWTGPVSSETLSAIYQDSDIFVFPTNFEGQGMVVMEAMASGLPVITTQGRGADDQTGSSGHLVQPENLEALVESLRWFAANREKLAAMALIARAQAEKCTWEAYRKSLSDAVMPYI